MDFGAFPYTIVDGEDLSGQVVAVDGNYYTGCRLVGTQFVWSGEAPYGYAGCVTDGLQLTITGRAEMVVTTITAMLGVEGLAQLGYRTLENAGQHAKN